MHRFGRCHKINIDRGRVIVYMYVTMDEETVKKVFRRVQLCLMSLVGESGHSVSYSVVPDTFKISKVEDLSRGFRKYYFTADAYRESDLTVHDEDYRPEREGITGSVVLDKNFGLVRDDKGNIMIEPWKHVDLTRLKKILTPKGKTKQLLYDKLKRAAYVIAKIMEEYSLTPGDRIEVLISQIQQRISGATVSSDEALHHTQLEDVYANLIEGVMVQDFLTPEDNIKSLVSSVQNRLDNFEIYFEKLQKGKLKGPFSPSKE